MMADLNLETDVLVIGGGTAGSFAAVKACEAGARVALMEKAAIYRCGAASVGALHWSRIAPEDTSVEKIAEMVDFKRHKGSLWGEARVLEGTVNENLDLSVVRDAWDRVHDLEAWGHNMRWDDGKYKIIGGYGTGELGILRHHGRDIKRKMAEKVQSLPIDLLERTMVVDLLTSDGAVVGATAVDVRTGRFLVCRAKATILATGRSTRLYNPRQGSASGKFKMIYFNPNPGDGHVLALRAGAQLLNMELAVSNSRNLLSQYDWLSFSFGGFLDTRVPIVNSRGEKVAERFLLSDKFLEEARAGRAPCFWDPTQLPEEAHRDLEMAYQDERPIIARFASERGLNSRTTKFEMAPYKAAEISPLGGILINESAQTSLKGLYAAGDAIGGTNTSGIGRASALGARAGTGAAIFAQSIPSVQIDNDQVAAHREVALAPRKRRGEDWLELEMKVRDIMERYCGAERSEGSLRQGQWRLQEVKERFLGRVGARNSHELMRALEVRNLFHVAEVHLLAALERKESGLGNYRLDYPQLKDAPWKEAIVVRQDGEDLRVSRGKMPSVNPAYLGKG